MNLADFGVLAVIIGFGLMGLYTGLILSVFKIASYFLSVFLSIKLYPQFSKMIANTALFDNIKNAILNNLLLQRAETIKQAGEQAKQATVDAIVNKLPLPEFLKTYIVSHIPETSELIDINKAMEAVSVQITNIIISIISLIILYIAIRIALIIVKHILEGVTQLPIIKQFNKLGGFMFGAFEGLLTVYIIFAVIMLFNSSPSFLKVYETIKQSMIAKYFFENNFIINFMFPNSTTVISPGHISLEQWVFLK